MSHLKHDGYVVRTIIKEDTDIRPRLAHRFPQLPDLRLPGLRLRR